MFSANTLHIMGWDGVEAFFRGVGEVLEREGGTLVVYGPFNHDGGYTCDSNRDFDAWLKARDPRSGIRDFVAVDVLARGSGLQLVDDLAMRSEVLTSESQLLIRISNSVIGMILQKFKLEQ